VGIGWIAWLRVGKNMKHDITADRLRQLFDYNKETGLLTWRRSPKFGGVRAGDVAGTPSGSGYLSVMVDQRRYRAARLIWLHVTGNWPSGLVDHKNGIRDDNTWENLRDVDAFTNSQNQTGAMCHNKSGYLGVSKHGKKWYAHIKPPGSRQRHIGVFDSPEAAHAAYLLEKRKLHAGCTI
jgi:hypothetical protein